jgi:hypothetical protein
VGVLGSSFVPSEAPLGTHEIIYVASSTYSSTVCTTRYVTSVRVVDCSENSDVYIIIGIVIGIVVVLLVVSIVAVALYCRSKKQPHPTEMQMDVVKSNNEDLPIITDVEVKHKIGHGKLFQLDFIMTHSCYRKFWRGDTCRELYFLTSIQVYYGMWGSTEVALKRLKNKDEEKSFLRELTVLSTLRHPSKFHRKFVVLMESKTLSHCLACTTTAI